MKNEWIAYRDFESSINCADRSSWKIRFSQAWKWFYSKASKMLAGESEPVIYQLTDRDGDAYWYVYDPATGRNTYLASEHDVRVWLEQRYQANASLNRW